MSILSTIGKIAGIAGAPFTGGMSLIPALVSTGLDVAGGIAKGRAADRAQTDAYNATQDQNAILRAKMVDDQARANLNAVPTLYSRALLGDVTSGLQPLAYGADGKLAGGISSALFSDATRDAGRSMSADAVKRMLSANPIGLSEVPQPTARQQPGTLDKILGYAGLAGTAIRGVSDAMRPPEKQITLDDLTRIFGGRSGAATSGQRSQTYGSGPMGDSGAMSYNPVSSAPGRYSLYPSDETMDPDNIGIARTPRARARF